MSLNTMSRNILHTPKRSGHTHTYAELTSRGQSRVLVLMRLSLPWEGPALYMNENSGLADGKETRLQNKCRGPERLLRKQGHSHTPYVSGAVTDRDAASRVN